MFRVSVALGSTTMPVVLGETLVIVLLPLVQFAVTVGGYRWTAVARLGEGPTARELVVLVIVALDEIVRLVELPTVLTVAPEGIPVPAICMPA